MIETGSEMRTETPEIDFRIETGSETPGADAGDASRSSGEFSPTTPLPTPSDFGKLSSSGEWTGKSEVSGYQSQLSVSLSPKSSGELGSESGTLTEVMSTIAAADAEIDGEEVLEGLDEVRLGGGE